MAKTKNLIRLISTATKTVINKKTGKSEEKKTGTFFVTTKNPKGLKATQKMEFKKFDPIVKKHVIFKEAKIK